MAVEGVGERLSGQLARLVELAEAQSASRPARLLTAEEAALKIGMKTTRPIDHLKIKIGRANRWKESTLDAWINAQVEGENRQPLVRATERTE